MDPTNAVTTITDSSAFATLLRGELLRLAATEDELATQEAVEVPYWAPCPVSVLGHRAAARVLRADADRFLVAVPGLGAAS